MGARQAFGARRYAYNWALGQVKANLDARTADPTVPPLSWNFYELRKAWNQAKHDVAPWWRCTSKEAYASGIADLVAGAPHLVGRQGRPPQGRTGRVPTVQGPRPGAVQHRRDAP